MYLPKYFSTDDKKRVRELIAQNSFTTLLSFPKAEKPFISHLPLIFSPQTNEDNLLLGHMARSNPQWKHFKDNPEALAIINGPHTYITPRWYQSDRDVPTWNYAVAHLHGKIELVEKFSEQVQILMALTEFFESHERQPWAFAPPEDLLNEEALPAAIISFRFRIEKIEAKFKLSQNRSIEDRQGVIEGLNERQDQGSRAIREIMRSLEKMP